MTATLTPPTGDARVYVAIGRRGVLACRPTGDGITGCGRSTKTGLTARAADAIERWAVRWCPRCWTPGAGLERTPGVADPGSVLKPVATRTIWRDTESPGRRLRVLLVTKTEVRAQSTLATTTDAWRHASKVTFSRAEWQRRMRRETAQDLGALR